MAHLRIATYNVHGAVGMDGRCRPDRPLEVLRSIDADVIALQEFVEHPAPGRESLLAHWRDALRLEACRFAPAFERGGVTFGNALLSRFPVREWREHDFSAPGCLPRRTLQALIPVEGREITFTVLHLGVRPSSRAAQRPLLEALIDKCGDAPHVVLGDFNEWHSWNRTFQLLRNRFSCGPSLPSFPAMAPALALDRIWISAGHQLLSTRVETHPLARAASDHLPVVVLLEF